jgi:hypothetical protein
LCLRARGRTEGTRSSSVDQVSFTHASHSLRKEIRLRPGYALRETFTEKYLPPAARRRTSTWNPLFVESSASSPSSPHRHDSSLPSTPRDFRQGAFVHESNRGSIASQSDNWRRPNSGFASNARLPATVGKGAEAESTSLAVETPERNPAAAIAPQVSTALVKTDAITSTSTITTVAQATVPVVDQNTPIEFADHLSSPHALDISTEKEMGSSAETTKASETAGAADNDQENHQLEAPSPTPSAFTAAGRESRRPLRDITFSFSVPKSEAASEYPALAPPTVVETPAIFSQVSDIFPKGHLFKTPTRTSEDFERAIRETALDSPRKRRQSAADSNLPVFQFKGSEMMSTPSHPNRLPRARRSAPHLGKYAGKQQQQQHQGNLSRATQTPDGLKRRRMRTASSRGVENWTINLASASAMAMPTIDRSGQIVLPAGTGWKGRSLSGAGQIPQRQRQPTTVLT